MREYPDCEIEDGAVTAEGTEAFGFTYRAFVGPDDLFAGYHPVPVRFQPGLEPVLETAIHFLDLFRYECASIRKRQDSNRCHDDPRYEGL